jgi:metacaspase-1
MTAASEGTPMAKVALCIGINNYPGTDMDLQGCVNDAEDWAAELGKRGYSVQTLLDSAATKKGMTAKMRSILGDARNGDSVVFTYSGHGTYAPDLDNDEADGFDEALCPYDIREAGALLDDEIHTIFAARKPGVSLLLISDSCHSGTVTRAAKDETDIEGPKPRFMPMGNWLSDDRLPKRRDGSVAPSVAVTAGDSPFRGVLAQPEGDLLLAGCAEGPNNFSYDAKIGGRFNGAFTAYALKTLKTLAASKTYADWHAAIRKYLPSASYPQSPQIFGDAGARNRKVFT